MYFIVFGDVVLFDVWVVVVGIDLVMLVGGV